MSKTIWEMKTVGNYDTVCRFNSGYSHIAVDGGCWVILNNGKISSHIFSEAAVILKSLPSDPQEYQPWREFIGMVE